MLINAKKEPIAVPKEPFLSVRCVSVKSLDTVLVICQIKCSSKSLFKMSLTASKLQCKTKDASKKASMAKHALAD